MSATAFYFFDKNRGDRYTEHPVYRNKPKRRLISSATISVALINSNFPIKMYKAEENSANDSRNTEGSGHMCLIFAGSRARQKCPGACSDDLLRRLFSRGIEGRNRCFWEEEAVHRRGIRLPCCFVAQ